MFAFEIFKSYKDIIENVYYIDLSLLKNTNLGVPKCFTFLDTIFRDTSGRIVPRISGFSGHSVFPIFRGNCFPGN